MSRFGLSVVSTHPEDKYQMNPCKNPLCCPTWSKCFFLLNNTMTLQTVSNQYSEVWLGRLFRSFPDGLWTMRLDFAKNCILAAYLGQLFMADSTAQWEPACKEHTWSLTGAGRMKVWGGSMCELKLGHTSFFLLYKMYRKTSVILKKKK